MDWTPIIIALLSGTSLAGIIEAIRYRRENKKLKENEVKKDDVATQREQMNLADDYKDKVLKLSELSYEATLKNGRDNAAIIEKVDAIAANQTKLAAEQARLAAEQARLADELKEVKQEQGLEREFLNGAYDGFRKKKEAEARRKAAAAKKTQTKTPKA